jgi:hypothetical protein
MFDSTINYTPRPFRKKIGFISCAIALLTFLFAGRLGAQTVATYSFEDGTADGWSSFNGASEPVATNAASHGGSFSLLTTTGSGGAGGPSILVSSVLLPGAKYTITGFVQLTGGETATNANFTIRRSDASCSGGTCFDTVGTFQVPVGSSGWAQIGGTYTVSTTETGLQLLCATCRRDDGTVVLSGRCCDYRDGTASRWNSDCDLYVCGWRAGWVGSVWVGLAEQCCVSGA